MEKEKEFSRIDTGIIQSIVDDAVRRTYVLDRVREIAEMCYKLGYVAGERGSVLPKKKS